MQEDASTQSARLALLIPAFEPDEQLLRLLESVCTGPFSPFVVVLVIDDGSSAGAQPILAQASRLPRVYVIRHQTNRGKGRSLKMGLEELLRSYPSLGGVVTADADGQHVPPDIVRLAAVLAEDKHNFLLGARTMASVPDAQGSGSPAAKMPLRSALGNTLTRCLFSVLYGTRIRDTQTGLRGFARELIPELLAIPGERYDYEMAVLTHLCRQGVYPQEVPVATVYLEQNRRSHFRPLQDSMRIYRALLRPLWKRRQAVRWYGGPSRAR